MIKLICIHCNNEFESKNKNRKFCSMSCKIKHQTKIKEIICPICNKAFHQKSPDQIFCSVYCSNISRQNKENFIVCKFCGKEFKRIDKENVYCSKQCYQSDIRLTVYKKKCKTCGKEFLTKRENAQFCSQNCHYNNAKPKKIIKCKCCGKEILTRKDIQFCSQKCHYEFNLNETNLYKCKNCGIDINSNHKRTFCSKKCRDEWSKTDSGRSEAGKRAKGKTSPKRGTKLSEETKKKISISVKKSMGEIMHRKGANWRPFFNETASKYFILFDKENNTSGQHALNGGERHIYNNGNIFLDYINDDLKLIIEYDEIQHKYHKEKDEERESRIKEKLPEYRLVRIDDEKVNSYEDFIFELKKLI